MLWVGGGEPAGEVGCGGVVAGAVGGAVVGTGAGVLVGAVLGARAGPVVGAGAALGVGTVAAGIEGAAVEPPTEEVDPAAAAGWAAAGRGTTEPAGLCVGTEPELVVVVLGRGAWAAAGMPAGPATARGG